ncbi:nicotinamide/nicotinic acid mononucleotide adenylyltransferase [Trifolium repens]|nr:nicotinamide/nicotinic acid mononucleotide adenylyltransferase [Trifolium repens]
MIVEDERDTYACNFDYDHIDNIFSTTEVSAGPDPNLTTFYRTRRSSITFPQFLLAAVALATASAVLAILDLASKLFENRRLGCIIANQILQLDELFFLVLIVCIFWIPEQVNSICRDYGVVCIRREGQNVEKTISDDNILNENQDVGAT